MYDRLKWLAQIGLPAVGALYFALSGTLMLPASEQVVGTVVALDTFLGVLLGLSTASYNKTDLPFSGSLNVFEPEEGKKLYQLELNGDPSELEKQSAVIFKVEHKA